VRTEGRAGSTGPRPRRHGPTLAHPPIAAPPPPSAPRHRGRPAAPHRLGRHLHLRLRRWEGGEGEEGSGNGPRTPDPAASPPGVIWRGDSVIPGVPATLTALREAGKRLVFVTNNSTKSRAGYLKKFTDLGLRATAEEIYSSSYAAAAYLQSIDFPADKKVYVVGEQGILDELDLAGIRHCGGPADAGKGIDLAPGYALPHDADVGAVVVGFDRHINYYKMQVRTRVFGGWGWGWG